MPQAPAQPANLAAAQTTGRPLPAWAVAAIAALLALATRVPFLPQQLHDHDSVNFAHGLQQFDLARHSPHLPGYPVYLAVAKLAQLLGAPVAAALAWPGVVGAMAAAAALAVWLAPRIGSAAALGLAALYLLLPDLALADLRPLSDGLGAHLATLLALTTAAALTSHAPGKGQQIDAGRGAMLLAGALLGVRLSSWPLAVVAAAAVLYRAPSPRERWLRLGFLTAVVLAWALPLLWLAGGAQKLVGLGFAFAQGHFSQWRGDSAPLGLAESAGLWLGHLWRGGALGLLGAAVAALTWGPKLADRRGPRLVLAMAAAYALWLGLGQNPERSRHILPLVALAAVALAQVASQLARGPRWPWAAGIALVALASLTLPRQYRQSAEPTPDVALGMWLATQPPEGTLLLGGSEVGVLRWQAPARRSMRVASPADLQAMLRDPATQAPRLYASSRVPGLQQLRLQGLQLIPVAHFAARPNLDLPQQSLSVYRVLAPQPAALSQRFSQELP